MFSSTVELRCTGEDSAAGREQCNARTDVAVVKVVGGEPIRNMTTRLHICCTRNDCTCSDSEIYETQIIVRTILWRTYTQVHNIRLVYPPRSCSYRQAMPRAACQCQTHISCPCLLLLFPQASRICSKCRGRLFRGMR